MVSKTPDWSEWAYKPNAEDWQAIALSMRLEPNDFRCDEFEGEGVGPHIDPSCFPSRDAHKEFKKRLRILRSNVTAGKVRETRLHISAGYQVDLPSFAAWAVDVVRWDVPSELSALAGTTGRDAAPAGEIRTNADAPPMGNSTKGRRAQPLAAEIEAAKLEATDPHDYQSVFAVLRSWAEKRKPPFQGFAEGEGLQYLLNTDVPKYLSLDALRKRMNPGAR